MDSGLLSWRERGWLWLRLAVRLSLGLSAWLLVKNWGRPLLSLSAPFLAALAAASLLDPPVRALQRRAGWSRQFSALLFLLLLLGLAGGALTWLVCAAVGELAALTAGWEELLSSAQALAARLDGVLEELAARLPIRLAPPGRSLLEQLLLSLRETLPDLSGLLFRAGEGVRDLSSFLLSLLFFVMATYLLTADWPYLRTKAAQSMGDGARRLCGQLRATALGAFGGYLRAQLLLSGGVFLILLAGFSVTRQPYGLLLAAGLAVLDFIPVLGAGTAMVPWAFLELFAGDLPAALRLMVIWSLVALFRRAAEPKFVGDQTGLPPLLSLVSVYAGMRLCGVAGMVFGPILALVLLNLAGMGMFRGLRLDLEAAFRDLSAVLAGRAGGK